MLRQPGEITILDAAIPNEGSGALMQRTFVTSTRRRQCDLEGAWAFQADPQDVGLTEEWYRSFPAGEVSMWMPGVWNSHRSYLNYEGVGWLRRSFVSGTCPAAVLHFGGVTHQANVWLDGEPLGEHYGGHLPFSFLLAGLEPGVHDLAVRIDNTHDMVSTIPSANLDWHRYGGISRPVWIEELVGPGYICSLRLTPVLHHGQAILKVRAEVVNLTDEPLDDVCVLAIEGAERYREAVHLEIGGSQVLLFAVTVPDAEPWTPTNPRLYTAALAFAGDEVIERTGFREIRVEGTQILLNGEPLVVRGVNRHEDHPDWGPALPEHLMIRDLDLLRDLGANAIRGSHYPQDPRMLDLCDERGILFVEEIPLWGFKPEQLGIDLIGDRAAAMMWAMVDRDVNHPCIWAWSVLNECGTEAPEGRAVVERLVETVRELDDTRLVTYASDRWCRDICYDLVDVVCINAYYGWYRHDLSWPAFLDRMRAKIGQKPMIVSEFGAGALFGYHALEEGVMWSEEYQRDLLQECLLHFMGRSDLAGFFVWQFFDMRTDGGARALGRPRSFNNKGLLDEYRRPKLAYYAVRDLLHRGASSSE